MHVTHVPPPLPHSTVVFPAWQTLFEQHPEQAPGPQTHVPFWQAVPAGQATQTPPPVPQSWFVLPVLQVVPSQQPVHVPGPQRVTHWPAPLQA